mmetsp:Transcript_24742/g.38524  ORF Transcript_24742/g.38524 Transcript_24742/m.38524 type:complete len:130 (-) Transcript_24742:27-416(-)
MQSYQIDEWIDSMEDLSAASVNFIFPQMPGYKDKDEHFTQFIIKHFPAYLQRLEDHFSTSGMKFLAGDSMTLADLCFASFLLRLPYNDEYPNCHILQAIVQKFPRTRDYCESLVEEFKQWKESALKSER